jgi:hypothetical protein
MAKLSDTQLVILSTACQRDDRLVLPLPDRLKGGAANKVIWQPHCQRAPQGGPRQAGPPRLARER